MGLSVFAAPTSRGVHVGEMLGLPAAAPGRSFGQASHDLSDGVTVSVTYVLAHRVASPVNVAGLRLVYTNWQFDGNSAFKEINGVNSITVGASLELPNGSGGQIFGTVTFGGADTVVIPAGGMAISDPIEVLGTITGVAPVFAPGQVFRTRTWVVAGAGGKWPLSAPKMVGNVGGGASPDLGGEGTFAGDLRATASGWSYATSYPYGPAAILASHSGVTRIPSIAVVGDSIANGYEDTAGVYNGLFQRALATKVGHVNIGSDSENTVNFQNTASGGGKTRWRRLRMLDGCTHAYVMFGRNDLTSATTAATIETNLTEIAQALTTRGMKVYLATIPPSSTSTDSFATVVNQTTAADNAQRLLLNAWIRSVPAPCAGYIEIADAVESARDSGKWKASHTTVGIHPNAVGAAAAAAAVPIPLLA